MCAGFDSARLSALAEYINSQVALAKLPVTVAKNLSDLDMKNTTE
jgi:hypothetical protein